jgi:hypothetical protein
VNLDRRLDSLRGEYVTAPMCSPLPLAGENKLTSVHRQHDASPINVRTAILWQNTPHNAQLAWPHLSAPMSLSTRLLQLRRASDTCPMLIADVLTLSYYRGGMLGFGIEPRWCYRSRRMATSSMPAAHVTATRRHGNGTSIGARHQMHP